jgi:predicted DNA-binding mobile mystery protein A
VEAQMKKRYKDLRRRQIQQNMTGLQALRDSHRPPGGWLRTIRQSLKLTLPELAKKLGITKSTLIGFELREADDSITLATLKRVAEAMDCKLVYAIVPKTGTLDDIVEKKAYDKATALVRAVDTTMSLEDQSVGRTEERIKEVAKRILEKS